MKIAGYLFVVFYFTVSRGVCSDIPSKLALSIEYGCGESETSVYVDDACLSISPIPRYNSSLGSLIQYRCQSRIGLQLTANIDYCPVQVCNKNRTWSTPSISCAVSECVDPDKVYSGRRNCTKSGLPCQLWSRQKPHKHKFIHNSSFPDKSVTDASSYCRDPDKFRGAPWCFTQDPNIQWEYCDIPDCKELPLNNRPCSEKGELNSKVDCGMPDFQINADNDCVSLEPLSPFSLTEGSIVINRCASLQQGVFPVSEYCPVEVCQQNGTWRSAYVSCAETECYNKGQSKLYKGKRICTSKGIYCIEWQTIDLITFDPDAFLDDSISTAASYCRDPKGQKGAPWCYVDKKGDWDYCSIPECSDIPVIETACTKKSEVTISVVESSINDRNGKIPFVPVYESKNPTTKSSITQRGPERNEINYTDRRLDVYSWKTTYEVPIIKKVNVNNHTQNYARENTSLPDHYHTTVPFTDASDGRSSKQKNSSITKHVYTTTPFRNVTNGDHSTMKNRLLPEHLHNTTTPVRNFADGENSTQKNSSMPKHYHYTTTPVRNVRDGDNSTMTSLLTEHNHNTTTLVRNVIDGDNIEQKNSSLPKHYHNTTTPVQNVIDGDNSTQTNSSLFKHYHKTSPIGNVTDIDNSTHNKSSLPDHYFNITTLLRNVIDNDYHTLNISSLPYNYHDNKMSVKNVYNNSTQKSRFLPENYNYTTVTVRHVFDTESHTQKYFSHGMYPTITTAVRNHYDGGNHTLENNSFFDNSYNNNTTPFRNISHDFSPHMLLHLNLSEKPTLQRYAINTESTFLNNANDNMKAYQHDTTDRVVSSKEIAYNTPTATFSNKSYTSTLNTEVTPGWPNSPTTFEKILHTKNTVLRDILTSPLKIKTALPSNIVSTTEDDTKITYNKIAVTKENFPVTKHYNIHTPGSTDKTDNDIKNRIRSTVTIQDTELAGFVSLHQILTDSVHNKYKINSDSMDFVTMGEAHRDYIKHGLNSIPEENYDMVATDAIVGTESIRNEPAQSTNVNYLNLDTNEPSDQEFVKDLGFMTSQGNYKTVVSSVPVTTSNDGFVLTAHEDYNTVDFGVITGTKYNKHTVVSTSESRNHYLITHIPYTLPLVNTVRSTRLSDEITLRKETPNYKGVDKDAITRPPFIFRRTDDTAYLYRSSTVNPNGPITVSGVHKDTRSMSDVKAPSLATNYISVKYKKPTNVDSGNVTISVIRETFSQTERRSMLTNFQFLNNNNMATIAENIYMTLGILTYKFIKNGQRFTQQDISRIQIIKTENELQSAVNACETKHNANQNNVESLLESKKFNTDSNLRYYTSQSDQPVISSHNYSQIHHQQFDHPFSFHHSNEADIQFNSSMSLIIAFNAIECARKCEGNESCILFRFRSRICELFNINITADGGICSQSAFPCYVKSC